jgi:hypothetical protein
MGEMGKMCPWHYCYLSHWFLMFFLKQHLFMDNPEETMPTIIGDPSEEENIVTPCLPFQDQAKRDVIAVGTIDRRFGSSWQVGCVRESGKRK